MQKTKQLDAKALGFAGASVSAIIMFVMWLAGNIGWWGAQVKMMMVWHNSFTLSVIGLLGGMVEAAVYGFIILYGIAWFYNRFSATKQK